MSGAGDRKAELLRAYFDEAGAGSTIPLLLWLNSGGGQMRNFVLGHQLGSSGYLCTTAPFRPDVALAFHGTLTRGDYDGAWRAVARWEDRWLAAAVEIGWLRAIKTALFLHGLQPSDRLGGTWTEATRDEREAVGRVLTEVFGPIERVGL